MYIYLKSIKLKLNIVKINKFSSNHEYKILNRKKIIKICYHLFILHPFILLKNLPLMNLLHMILFNLILFHIIQLILLNL
jgi:hypothetical protein